jgi:hypothetical protein
MRESQPRTAVPLVGTARLTIGVSVSEAEAVVIVDELQSGWTELTEEEYLAAGGSLPTPVPLVDTELEQLKMELKTTQEAVDFLLRRFNS